MKKKPIKKKRTQRKAKSRTKKPAQPNQQAWYGRLVILCVVLIMLGGFGLWWKNQVLLKQVHVDGTLFSDPESIHHLANLDSSMLFFDINLQAVSEQVSQNPWVESASVRRLPNAELAISVRERKPALLVLDPNGKPDRFIDSYGYQMPFIKEAIFDVPLLMGLNEEFHPTELIQQPVVLSLLEDLHHITDDVDALISAFMIKPNGELFLETNPIPGRGSIDVRLGHENFAPKLSKLHAFWHQTVLTKREHNIQAIDLRFDSQIVTQEVRLSQ
ncbi:MAG: FtsQ-type POTRA domain-containing protein [Rhodothermaceae bacterium]|nr:FtsQ-type POTRA domain-containing protein [Rhodothermaceae bacterium]